MFVMSKESLFSFLFLLFIIMKNKNNENKDKYLGQLLNNETVIVGKSYNDSNFLLYFYVFLFFLSIFSDDISK